ncbi:MAG TPA: phosphate acyltransferase PlsX [Candidatus Binatia bacterium]|nr:phosphate acyltransferase PlsX [Candidatus Binatia bacterium]
MPAPIRVAVDVMSGENDPRAAVWGALEVVADGDAHALLVGVTERIQAEFDAWRAAHPSAAQRAGQRLRSEVEIVPAADVIGMDEHPAQAVRGKRDASVVVATRLVREGRASAAVSAGNSGATFAAALFTVGRVAGVDRPAIGTDLPTPTATTFLIDAGTNADCRPEWLLQFGIMGAVYARLMKGVERPRVALLSNGEEPDKGSRLVQEAHRLLLGSPLEFTGNVEGHSLLTGICDVAVTDGFTGNVVLKTAEGVAEFLFGAISREARSSLTGRAGGALLKPRLRPLRDRVDYRKTGGALLLGVAGEVVIAHGRSDAEAMANAIRVAVRASRQGLSAQIAEALRALPGERPGDPEGGGRGGGAADGGGSTAPVARRRSPAGSRRTGASRSTTA